MTRNWLVIGAALLVVGTAACGDDENGGDDGNIELKTACEIFTTQEVSDAVGNPVADGKATGTITCNWFAADGGNGDVTLNLNRYGADEFDATLEANRKAIAGKGEVTEISDVGDKGFLVVQTQDAGGTTIGVATVVAIRDEHMVTVTVGDKVDGSTDPLVSATKDLARKALERI